MSVFYSIRHLTRFRYSSLVSESILEIRKEPRTEGRQRCLDFRLLVSPAARIMTYRDYLGNMIHHFDVPGQHRELQVIGEATVEVQPANPVPEKLDESAWTDVDAANARPVTNCATATRSAGVSVAPWAAILPLVSAFTIASGE